MPFPSFWHSPNQIYQYCIAVDGLRFSYRIHASIRRSSLRWFEWFEWFDCGSARGKCAIFVILFSFGRWHFTRPLCTERAKKNANISQKCAIVSTGQPCMLRESLLASRMFIVIFFSVPIIQCAFCRVANHFLFTLLNTYVLFAC